MGYDSDKVENAVESAPAYREVSELERRKLDLLLTLRLHEVLQSNGSLQELMRDIGREAKASGLTPQNFLTFYES
jgi:hypothetical protein